MVTITNPTLATRIARTATHHALENPSETTRKTLEGDELYGLPAD